MQSLQTPDGSIEIERHEGTRGAGSIVLLHGIQGTSAAWNSVVGLLDTPRTVVLPNLRGRGTSLTPDEPSAYTLQSFARDLGAVIESLEGPTLLVGWSMGVLVSLTYIQDYGGGRLDGLVLASGTAHPGTEAVWFNGRTIPDIEEEAVARAERLGLRAVARPVAVAGAWAAVREADLRDMLPDIAVPTLVLHGAEDDQCPAAHGRAIAAAVPGAAFDLWEGRGHSLMLEDPPRLAATIQRMAQSLPASNMRAANQ